MRVPLASIIVLIVSSTIARAESVEVKYRGTVNLPPFECTILIRSSLVERVCYDSGESYMLIKLRDTYYHYCETDADTVRQGNFSRPSQLGASTSHEAKGGSTAASTGFRLTAQPCRRPFALNNPALTSNLAAKFAMCRIAREQMNNSVIEAVKAMQSGKP